MDVVKKDITALGGTVSTTTETGKGTKFTLKLPLTLAIIEGILVKIGNASFVVPLSNVVECLEFERPENTKENLEVLSTRLKNEQTALNNIQEKTLEVKASLMQKKGVSEWTIRNDLFNNFIHQFTVVSDKLTAGNVTGIDIEEGVEAGDITFF